MVTGMAINGSITMAYGTLFDFRSVATIASGNFVAAANVANHHSGFGITMIASDMSGTAAIATLNFAGIITYVTIDGRISATSGTSNITCCTLVVLCISANALTVDPLGSVTGSASYSAVDAVFVCTANKMIAAASFAN